MTEIKTLYDVSWVLESTAFGNPGNGAYTALEAGDTAYLFGDYFDSPSLSAVIQTIQERQDLLNSRDFDTLTEQKFLIKSRVQFGLMDGIPFYWALGAVSDGADGGTKTHTITGIDPTVELPSITIHYEGDDNDGTSQLDKDIFANRVDRFQLNVSRFQAVKIMMDLIGGDLVDSVGLSSPPALKATAVDSVFRFGQGTYTWNSNPQDHILDFNLQIQNNLKVIWVDRSSNSYRMKYLDAGKRIINWSMTVNLKNKTLIDEVKANVARTFSIVFTRTGGNDNITITLANSTVSAAPLQATPFSENRYVLSGITKTMTVVVRDAIESYD